MGIDNTQYVSSREAIEKALKAFTTYCMSLLGAMMLYDAVEKTLDRYRHTLWRRWMWALIVLLISLSLLILVTYLDSTNDG